MYGKIVENRCKVIVQQRLSFFLGNYLISQNRLSLGCRYPCINQILSIVDEI